MSFIVDVGGEIALLQSVRAAYLDVCSGSCGLVGGFASERPSLLETLWNLCVLLGQRQQFRDMNHFVGEKSIDLAVDNEMFAFEAVKEAYESWRRRSILRRSLLR